LGEILVLFSKPKGIIPACDFPGIELFEKLIKATCDIEGIVGYKIGCILGLRYGLTKLVSLSENYTDIPIIYDHQKSGTDIPQMGEIFANTCSEAGIKGVIIFPQSGPTTEESFINAAKKANLIPIVGGEMTHPKYLERDGGFIRDNAPKEMYQIAARNDVDHFVIPGNKPEAINSYHKLLSSEIEHPIYCLPGIGRQGGDIKSSFRYLEGFSAYAIVGTSIYGEADIRSAAKKLCGEVLE